MTSRKIEQRSSEAEEQKKSVSSAPHPPCSSPPKAPVILVVDDEEHLCWILRKVFSEAGYTVYTARSGKEALQVWAQHKVAVAIIDYRLPDMNGIELFQRLNGTGQSIAGILITSYGSAQLRSDASAAGFVAYFDKPLSHQKLLERLATVTGTMPGATADPESGS